MNLKVIFRKNNCPLCKEALEIHYGRQKRITKNCLHCALKMISEQYTAAHNRKAYAFYRTIGNIKLEWYWEDEKIYCYIFDNRNPNPYKSESLNFIPPLDITFEKLKLLITFS